MSLCFISFRIFIVVQSKTAPFACSTADLKNVTCNLPTSCRYQDIQSCAYYYKCCPQTASTHPNCPLGQVYYVNNKKCDLYSLYSVFCPPGSI